MNRFHVALTSFERKVRQMAEKLTVPRRYDTGQDVSMRLDGTYLRYKGVVVLCNYSNDLHVMLTPLVASPVLRGAVTVHSSNEDLDISSIPLGFYATHKQQQPIVFRRRPVRRYKQGVCLNNIEGAMYNINERQRSYLRDRDIQGYLQHTGFHLMLANQYSTPDKAIKYVVENRTSGIYHSAAISLDFCFYSFGDTVALIDSYFEEVGVYDLTAKHVVVNEWWKTPTMMDRLRMMGVPLKE